MIKLACMTLPYAHLSFERSLQGISQAGYKYVALGLPHAGIEMPDENDPTAIDKLKKLFDQYGVSPIMLISTNQLAPGQPLERARARFEVAKALGIREVLSLGTWGYHTFPKEPLSEGELEALNASFAEKFMQVGRLAEEMNITVTLKPHTGNTATAKQMQETVARIGSGSVKISYDPGNVRYYEGVNPEVDMKGILDMTYSFIAKEHRGATTNHDFPIPGEGDIPFVSLFRQLREAPQFSGTIVIERLDGTATEPLDAEQIDERIKKARLSIEKMIGEAGL